MKKATIVCICLLIGGDALAIGRGNSSQSDGRLLLFGVLAEDAKSSIQVSRLPKAK